MTYASDRLDIARLAAKAGKVQDSIQRARDQIEGTDMDATAANYVDRQLQLASIAIVEIRQALEDSVINDLVSRSNWEIPDPRRR